MPPALVKPDHHRPDVPLSESERFKRILFLVDRTCPLGSAGYRRFQ